MGKNLGRDIKRGRKNRKTYRGWQRDRKKESEIERDMKRCHAAVSYNFMLSRAPTCMGFLGNVAKSTIDPQRK